MLKVGDTIKITDNTSYHGKIGTVTNINKAVIHFTDSDGFPSVTANLPHCYELILVNRVYLQEFIKLNQIKTTLVSKYLGHSPSWLTTMANEKRRGDLSNESLKAILKKLHIDWSSNEFINVKATKEHTAYRTRPNTYTTEVHKERLQKAMWLGEFK